jgi:hypothetical protein
MMLPTLPNDARDGESHSRSASMPRAMGRNQTSERKAMVKKRAPKRRVWNKGLEVGKRDGFTPDQVKRIRGLLADRGVPGLRDLALFSTAIDRLRGSPAMWVGDVDAPMSLVQSRRRSKSTTSPIPSIKGVWPCGESSTSDRRAAAEEEWSR